jgi:hypothetical protein
MKLSKHSKQLISFFLKNNHFNYDNNLNTKTKSSLKELYELMNEASQFVQQMPPYHIRTQKIENPSHLSKPSMFKENTFPKGIMEHIHKAITWEISFSFSLLERKIEVIFCFDDSGEASNIVPYYTMCTNAIATCLYMVNRYSSKRCVKSIQLFLYLTNLEKQFPASKNTVLDSEHVNTAFTTSCPIHSEIVIFRREEWFKVLIHETFHNFGLDFSSMSTREADRCVLSIFQVDSLANTYESYSECWAEIMNAVFCSFFATKQYEDFIETFDGYINLERTYSFFQLVKTLDFMGLTYTDLYSSSEQSRKKREQFYQEKTNVLAYYVLKTVLLNNYQGFLSWCHLHNSSLLQFKHSSVNLLLFCDFIKHNYKTKSMLRGIHFAESFFHSLKNGSIATTPKVKSFILSNLRMTVCELN